MPACDVEPGAACELAGLLGEVQTGPEDRASQPPDSPTATIDVAALAGLYGHELGDLFLLVSSPEVRQAIRLENSQGPPVEEMTWSGQESRSELIKVMHALRDEGKRCSVLWIATDEFEHYPEEDLANAKLAAISFFSNPFSIEMLNSYLRIVTGSAYQRELLIERQLLSTLDSSRRVMLKSPRFGVDAIFEHHLTEHWFSLHGPLDFGQQTVLPTGELAVLTNESGEFTMDSRFSLTGTLVLRGQPILHRGSRDASPQDTSEMFTALANMQRYAVLAHVKDGLIEDFESPGSKENPLMRVFETLIEQEPRYRKIHEVGFGTNASCAHMTEDNFFGNERWPGLHCGLGLGGYTPFHIDLALTEVDVFVETSKGHVSDLYRSLDLPHRAAASPSAWRNR